MRIFLPAGVFLLICAIYSGYWLWAADRMEHMVQDWAKEQQAGGAKVSWSSLKVGGYPFRLEAHIDKPSMAARDWVWQGDKFVLHMMPYSFRHYIGSFGGIHRIRLGAPSAEKPLVLEGEAHLARASLVIESRDAMRLSVDLKGLAANRIDPVHDVVLSRFGAERLQFHLRQWFEKKEDGELDARLAMAVQAENADFPAHRLKGLGSNIELAQGQVLLDELPVSKDGIRLTLSDYLRAWSSNGGKARFEGVDLRWDDIDISASGRLKLDRKGRPEGEIDASIGGHAAVMEVLRSNRMMKDEQAELVKQALAALNLVSQDTSGRLKLPVKMKRGDVYLGPVKLSRMEPVY